MIKFKLLFLLFIHLIVGILVGHFIINKNFLCTSNHMAFIPMKTDSKDMFFHVSSNVQIINLNEPIHGNFTCIKTKTLMSFISTKICLHDRKNDVFVSSSFRGTNSIWEENYVTRILQLLLRHPHLDFIDIGANIGTYTMYVAALGRFVLAIDCFAPNLHRIHRAVQLTNVVNRVVLIQNAIYTHSGRTLRLFNSSLNIGGQGLDLRSRNQTNNQNRSNNPYLVKTITFDELLPILIARGIRGVIMKIDIEGSESFVFESGNQVFDTLEIPFIQMEWSAMRHYPDRAKLIMNFFANRNYDPKTFSCQLLNTNQYKGWPEDVYWIKRNISNFCTFTTNFT